MALRLKDGYTLPFATESVLKAANGEALYSGLPVVSGEYRPPLYATTAAFEFALLRAASGEQESKLVAEFLAARIASWDVEYQEKPDGPFATAPITVDFIRNKLPDPIVSLILNKVRKWEGEQAASGN